MNILKSAAMMGLLVATAAGVQAGEVKVEGVHLCCGACVKGVAKALDGVKGVACDKDAGTVTFSAGDADAAKAGLKKLAKAGFGGKASYDGKAVHYPGSGVKKGQKADSATFSGVHLCCGGCVKAANAAVKDVDGVSDVAVDKDEKTVTVKGSGIDLAAVAAALSKHGFHGTLKK